MFVFAWLPLSASAQNSPPLSYRKVFIPEAELSTQIRGLLPMRRNDFERRIKLVERQRDQQAQAATVRIAAADYRAQFSRGQLVGGEAVLDIVASGAEPAVLPLAPCSPALSAAEWIGGSTSAVIGVDPRGQLVCLVPHSGKLRLGWSLAGQSLAGGDTAFDLRLPSAPQCRLSVETSGEQSLEIDSGLIDSSQPLAGPQQRRLWLLELGGQSQARLVVRSPAPAGEPPLVVVRESANYAVLPGSVDLDATLTLDVLGHSLSALTLDLDEPLQLTALRLGETALEWTVQTAKRVQVQLPAGLSGLSGLNRQLQISATAERPPGERWRLPRVRVTGGHWQEGRATVSAAPWLRLEAQPVGECAQTALTPAAAGRPLDELQFQLYAPQAGIEIATQPQPARLREQSGTDIRIDATQVSGVLIAELSSLGGERFSIEALVPRHWLLDAVETHPADLLADRTTTPRGQSGQLLRIRLSRPLAEARPLRLVVRGHFRRPAGQQPLPEDFFRLATFPEATDKRRLIAVRVSDPAAELRLLGDDGLVRLAPGQLSPAELRLFETRPSGLLFSAGKEDERLQATLAPSSPRLRADVLVQAHAERGQIRQTASIRCQPESAPIGTLQVRLLPRPPGSVTWRLAGEEPRELVAAAESAGADDEAVYRLTLARPRTASFELRGEWSSAAALGSEISVCWLPEASSQSGQVEILAAGGQAWQVQSAAAERLPLTASDSERFTPEVARFRYEPGRRAGILLQPLPARPAQAAAWVESLTLISHFSADGGGDHEVRLAVVNAGLTDLRLHLPPEVSNLRAAGDGPVAAPVPARNIAGTVIVALPAGQRRCDIHLRYSSSGSRLGWAPLGRCTAPVPQFDVPVLESQWIVGVAPGLAMLGPTTSLAIRPKVNSWYAALAGQNWLNLSGGTYSPGDADDPNWTGWTTHTQRLPAAASASVTVYRPEAFRVWTLCLGLAAGTLAVRWPLRVRAAIGLGGSLFAVALLVAAPWSWLFCGLVSGLAAGCLIGMSRWRIAPAGDRQSDAPGSTIVLAGGQTSGALLLAVCCFPQGAAWAAPQDDQAAARRWRVVIAVDNEQAPAGDYVYLDPELYEALHKLTSAAPRALPDWLLENARYELPAAVGGDVARPTLAGLRAVFDLQTFQPSATVLLPLRRDQVTLVERQARLDGQPLTPTWSEDGLRLSFLVESPGRHRLDLTLGAALQPTADGAVLSIEIPPAAQAIAVLPRASALRVPSAPNDQGAVGSEEAASAKERTIALGSDRKLQVRWPAADQPATAAAASEVEQLLWWRIRPGSVVVEGRFAIRNTAGPIRELLLAVDPRLRLVNGSLGAAVSRIVPSESQPQLVRVELAEPPMQERSIKLSWLWPDAGGTGALVLPSIAVQGRRVTRSWVAASVEAQWTATFAQTSSGPAALDFVRAWGEGATGPAAVAADSGTRPLELRVLPLAAEPAAEQSIDWSLSASAAAARATFKLSGVPPTLWTQRLTLPPQLHVLSVAVEQGGRQAQVRWTQQPDGPLTIVWLEPPSANQVWTIAAELPVARQRQRLPLPTIRLLGGAERGTRLRIFRQADVQISLQDAAGWTTEADPQSGQYMPGLGRLVATLTSGGAIGDTQPRVSRALNEPRLAGAMWLRVQEDDGDWWAEAVLDLNVSNGLLDQVRLSVPAEWAGPLSIEPAVEQQLLEPASDGRRQLLIRPQLAARGALQLVIRGPLAAGPSGMQAPDVRLLDAPGDAAWPRFLLLDNRAGAAQINWQTTGLQSLVAAEAELPAAWNAASGELLRSVAPEFAAVARVRQAAAAAPRVLLADCSARLTAADRAVVTSTFTIEPSGAPSSVFTLPPHARLVQVQLDDTLIQAQPAGVRTWLVSAPGAQLPYRLTVVTDVWLPRAKGALTIPAPQLAGMQVRRTLWSIAPDDETTVLPDGPAENIAAPKDLALARAESAAHALEQLSQATDLPTAVLAESFAAWWRSYQQALAAAGASPAAPRLQAAERARDRLLAAGLFEAEDLPAAEVTPASEAGALHFAAAGAATQFRVAASEAPVSQSRLPVVGLVLVSTLALISLCCTSWLVRWSRSHAPLLLATAGVLWWLFAPWGFLGWLLVLSAAWLSLRWPWPRGAFDAGSTIRRYA